MAFIVLYCIISIPIFLFSESLKTKDPEFYVQHLFIRRSTPPPPPSSPTPLSPPPSNSVTRCSITASVTGISTSPFFYGANRSFPVADYTVAGFYQGIGKTARKTAVVRTRGVLWGDAIGRISKGLTVDFAVELAGTVKLRRWGVYLKRKQVAAAAVVSLDGSGGEVDQAAVIFR